ncbi:MAG: VWA domain-containing protein [Planctomycetaceae bacterium]|nr:VWA domain-containing protein [Planctomycetales bacterium]MCB9921435.1 VWA domain-containing protein [Planctomycetaceae bacterium]
MLPLIAVIITILLLMSAYSVDVGYMHLVRTELRVATDASAKAGAEALARTQNEADGIAAAIEIAKQNMVAGEPLLLAPEDIVLGRAVQRGDGSWEFQSGATPSTALQVTGRRTANSKSGPVPLFFASMFGSAGFTPVQAAVAAHLDNEIVLAVDRSHSMAFDNSGIDWSYAPNNPLPSILSNPSSYQKWQIDLTSPPHPTGSRWTALDAAIDTFLNEAGNVSVSPRVSLVTWASEITLASYEGSLTGRTSPANTVDVALGTKYDDVRDAIGAYGTDAMFGGTDMAGGIDTAVGVLTSGNARRLASKTIILMTDGQQTGGRDPLLAAADARAAGITIFTVTFLDTADQTVMKQIATQTGGRHYHASNAEDLKNAFIEIARDLPVALVQ